MGWHHDLAADNARLIGAVLVFHCVCYRGSTLGGLIFKRTHAMSPSARECDGSPNLTFTLLAHQLHEMSRLVDEEEVAGVVEILSLEVFCPEPQLDLIVAYSTGIHHAVAEVQRDLLRWSEG